MIPHEIRFFTWVDIEDMLLHVRKNKGWPEWLKSAQAYFDGLTLEIETGKQEQSVKWLADTFEPRFQQSGKNDYFILLESLEDNPRKLAIRFDETDDAPAQRHFRPSLERQTTLFRDKPRAEPEPFPEDNPPIIALHSFKGGVGRTLHALAITKAISAQKSGNRVLLIDSDMEAPGITWLLKERIPNPLISFADLLALIHGDPNPNAENALRLIVDRVQNSQLEQIYLIPAFHSKMQFTSLQIRPQHLVQFADNPFIITHVLSQLGKIMGVDAVVIDLRAGLSEFSTGFLFDPRVHRFLITTLSPQSIQGTAYVLQLLEDLTPPKTQYPVPRVIISQIPLEYMEKKELIESGIKAIETVAQGFWRTASPDDEIELSGLKQRNILLTGHEQNLMVPGRYWDKIMTQLCDSNLYTRITEWLEMIPSLTHPEMISSVDPSTLRNQRKKLVEITEAMIASEQAKSEIFLWIEPVLNLANDFQRALPIALILGAEGTGKTYTFLHIIRCRQWENFIADSKQKDSSTINAGCYPVLYSKNLFGETLELINSTVEQINNDLGFGDPLNYEEFADYLFDYLNEDNTVEQWRKIWTNLIAWRMGFDVGEPGAGHRFLRYLHEQKKNVIAVIDGLDDILQDFMEEKSTVISVLGDIFNDFTTDEKKIYEKNENNLRNARTSFFTAIRVLLQEVPAWLNQQPGRLLGIVIFISRDMLKDALSQNAEQLMSLYAPYTLTWNADNALRLCVRIKEIVSSPEKNDSSELANLSETELNKRLIPLWGGDTDLITETLSNTKGHVRPKDMVRFINLAARNSIEDKQWKNCLLTPDAIRKTVKEYFMKLTHKQEIKLRQISDGWLYNEARTFIDTHGVIKNSQIAGLENVADTSKGYSEILKFINHQAYKDHKEIKKFYNALKMVFEEIMKKVKVNRDFIPDNLTKKQLREYKKFFGLIFAREFIHHLSAEHRYQSEDS